MHLPLPLALSLTLVTIAAAKSPAAASNYFPSSSSCFVFSPANWSASNAEPAAKQTWNAGAYFRLTFRTTLPATTVSMHFDVKQYGTWNGTAWSVQNPVPDISYALDGTITDNVAADGPEHDGTIPVVVPGAGRHTLTVWMRNSEQLHRWVAGSTGSNVLRVDGVTMGTGASPIAARPHKRWVLIVGDSITEGIQADNGRDSVLDDYSWLDAQALYSLGYETCISACGYSGWVRPGCADGDVPGYFVVNKSSSGKWVYDDAASRWNKIDGSTSSLDSRGRFSAYGGKGQEPALIFFNYGTNETLSRAGTARMAASVVQCLYALRRAAPHAQIVVAVPFGIENLQVYGPEGPRYAAALQTAVRTYQKQHPSDHRTHLVDLGQQTANALASTVYGAGVHPNMAGHAYLAPLVLQTIERFLSAK